MDVVEKTIEEYEAKAEEYAKIIPGIEAIKKEADFFIKNLKGKKILDVGCGPGRDTKYFTEQGLDVTAIDLTKALLEIAKKQAPKAQFHLMDMRKLKFPDNSFDGLWVNASLLHIPKKEAKQTVIGFKRILKPGGIIFIAVREGVEEKFSFDKGLKRFYANYTKEELENLIKTAGFEIINTTLVKKDLIFWIRTFAMRVKTL
jgi:ubiquinone/menaquinone biosynthesis C-methylase UbiE